MSSSSSMRKDFDRGTRTTESLGVDAIEPLSTRLAFGDMAYLLSIARSAGGDQQKFTEAMGGRPVEKVRQLSPPFALHHSEPVVEPMMSRSPVSSTSRPWR